MRNIHRRRQLTKFFSTPIGAFLLSLLIIFARGWPRFVHAEVWAEDGLFFTQQALANGTRSYAATMGGYFHVFSQTIALIATQMLPIEWLPRVYVTACYLLHATLASSVAWKGREWIAPKNWQRVTLVCLFGLLPGLNEAGGNLSNAHWYFYLWFFILALKDRNVPLTLSEIAISAIAAVSEGGAFLFAPVFMWRAWLISNLNPRGKFVRDAVVAGMLALAFVLIQLSSKNFNGASDLPSLEELINTVARTTIPLQFAYPFLGDRVTNWSCDYLLDGWIVSAMTVSAFWFFVRRRLNWNDLNLRQLFIAYGPLILYPILILVVRHSVSMPVSVGCTDRSWWWNRYSFPVAGAALIFTFAWIQRATLSEQTRSRLIGVIAFGIFNGSFLIRTGSSRLMLERYGSQTFWLEDVPSLRQSMETGCPRQVSVRLYPGEPWRINYENPIQNLHCP